VKLVNKAAAKIVRPVCDITYIRWPGNEHEEEGLHACISEYRADGAVLQVVRAQAQQVRTLGRQLPPPS
jgi:hypothetical protein